MYLVLDIVLCDIIAPSQTHWFTVRTSRELSYVCDQASKTVVYSQGCKALMRINNVILYIDITTMVLRKHTTNN
jgi:hypothetical protein